MIKFFINKISKNQKILISYSGGLDSTVLLYQLISFTKKYPFLKLRAIYIDHQINKNSEYWISHCKNTCQLNNIELIIKKIQINQQNNLQDTARKLRYQTIKKNMLPNEILVTGHHCDDQCETLFLSLKRGSGIKGLSGIQYKSNFSDNQTIIRPLLKYPKKQLKIWAIKNNITWIEDDSNFNNQYDRNFIRNTILNNIQKRWPHFIKNCTRSMKLCHQQEISNNYFLDQIIHKISPFKDILNIKKLYIYPKEIQILLIRRWIFLNKKSTISYQDTKNIYKNIIHKKNEHVDIKIDTKNIKIKMYKNKVFCIPHYQNIKNTMLFWHNYKKPLKLPQNLGYIAQDKYGISVPKPKKNELINIRFQLSEIIQIDTIKKRRKNIWQENKITPWNRNRIPSLFYNDKLIAIMGVLVTTRKDNINIWKLSWIDNIK